MLLLGLVSESFQTFTYPKLKMTVLSVLVYKTWSALLKRKICFSSSISFILAKDKIKFIDSRVVSGFWKFNYSWDNLSFFKAIFSSC
jgi:hypothetical protein